MLKAPEEGNQLLVGQTVKLMHQLSDGRWRSVKATIGEGSS